MAGRKRTMNRMAMRGDYDGEEERPDDESEEKGEDEDEEESDDDDAEDSEGDEDSEGSGEEDEDGEIIKPKKAKKKPAKAPAKPRVSRSKQVRVKMVWGVFNNSNQQLATYPWPQEADARAHAERLTNDKKTNHFVQKVKVPLETK